MDRTTQLSHLSARLFQERGTHSTPLYERRMRRLPSERFGRRMRETLSNTFGWHRRHLRIYLKEYTLVYDFVYDDVSHHGSYYMNL